MGEIERERGAGERQMQGGKKREETDHATPGHASDGRECGATRQSEGACIRNPRIEGKGWCGRVRKAALGSRTREGAREGERKEVSITRVLTQTHEKMTTDTRVMLVINLPEQ